MRDQPDRRRGGAAGRRGRRAIELQRPPGRRRGARPAQPRAAGDGAAGISDRGRGRAGRGGLAAAPRGRRIAVGGGDRSERRLLHELGRGPAGQPPRLWTEGKVGLHRRLPHRDTTLDAQLQGLAQTTVDHVLPPATGGPAAALVAIDNATGEVRAMVGGYNYNTNPFNLATAAERQPGSAWKVFDLAAALESGYKLQQHRMLSKGPWSYPQQPGAPNYGPFVVRNDEGGYYNAKIPLWEALAVSDNSAFARLGLRRPHRRHVEDRGHRAPVRDLDDDLAQPVDGHRRAERRRHAARHGARLPDDRQRRPADHRDADLLHVRGRRRATTRCRRLQPAGQMLSGPGRASRRSCSPAGRTTRSRSASRTPRSRPRSPATAMPTIRQRSA